MDKSEADAAVESRDCGKEGAEKGEETVEVFARFRDRKYKE